MKLYDLGITHCPELENYQEFKDQKPNPIGIMGCSVYRFNGTNVYSWYVKKIAGFWIPHGELIVLTKTKIKKIIADDLTAKEDTK